MLLSLFFPTYWKNKLLFAQKILSMGIQDGFFIACLSAVSRTKTTILNVARVPLAETTSPQALEAQTSSLKKTIKSLGKYDQLVLAESSEHLVFKELEFPFGTRDKINLILPEELEQQLPFNPEEGYTGFIVGEVRPDGTSTSLTATLKKTDFDVTFAPLKAADAFPDAITVDAQGIAFCINELYPAPQESEAAMRIIVDVRNVYTQLIFTTSGIIKAVKNLPLGKNFLYHNQLAKPAPLDPKEQAADAAVSNSEPAETTENAVPVEAPPAPAPPLLQENLSTFLDRMTFTCDALALKYCTTTTPQTLFFINPPCEASALKKALALKTDRSVEFVSSQPTNPNSSIVCAKECPEIDWTAMSGVVGVAGLLQTENRLDLPADVVQETLFSAIKKNIFVACLLFASVVGTVAAVGYRQLSALGRTLQIAENTQLTKLKEKFPEQLADQRKLTLKRAISHIEEYVKEQQICWNMFGAKSLNPLEVLYELTELIDRRLFTVDINHVTLILSDDDHIPQITVEGTFMSKTEAHYSDFGLLEKHIALSKRLILTKDIESSFDDNAHGVKFTARFKLRDA